MTKVRQSNLDYFDTEEGLFVIRYDQNRKTIPVEIDYIEDDRTNWHLYLVKAEYLEMDGYFVYDCRYTKF